MQRTEYDNDIAHHLTQYNAYCPSLLPIHVPYLAHMCLPDCFRSDTKCYKFLLRYETNKRYRLQLGQ